MGALEIFIGLGYFLLAFNGHAKALDVCPVRTEPLRCIRNPTNDKFRTISGECNNLLSPLWGSAGTQFIRLLPPQYEDGRSAPIGYFREILYEGFHKPNPRMISNNVMTAETFVSSPYHSALLAHFGQILAHDLSLQVEQTAVNCTIHPDDSDNCYNIQVQEDKVMPHRRSNACLGRALQREQLNMVTSFVDASQVYGSTELRISELREYRGGRLRVNDFHSDYGSEYMPFDDLRNRSICFQNAATRKYDCFLSGDPRPSEQIMLTALHTIFLREHNRIARELSRVNPHWDDERLFQESRKIFGAVMQKIVYEEWLPKILGDNLNHIAPYQGYNRFIDPSTANEFGAAVMRFGHGIMPPVIERRDVNYNFIPNSNEPLSKIFFAMEKFLDQGGTDPLIRGLITQPAKEIVGTALVNSELTQNLFPHNPNGLNLDLASLNINRAREHAIPGYNEWRKFCGLKPMEFWLEMREIVRDPELVTKLQRLYKRIDNIDLWVAGLIEKPATPTAKLGPTFTCLLKNQFQRLRDGDRFFYENSGVFTAPQLKTIQFYSMSKLICNTADDIRTVPADAFSITEGHVPCGRLSDLDLRLWAEAATFDKNQNFVDNIRRIFSF